MIFCLRSPIIQCPACAYEMQDTDQVCPDCIRAIDRISQPQSTANEDNRSFLLPLLGFVLPPGGLLFYFLNWQRYPRLASQVAVSSLTGGVVAMLSLFLYGMLHRVS